MGKWLSSRWHIVGIGALCLAVIPATANASVKPDASTTIDSVAMAAVASDFTQSLSAVYEATYGDTISSRASLVAPAPALVEELNASESGERAFEDELSEIRAIADGHAPAVDIDAVDVVEVGEPEMVPLDAETVSVLVDVQVTRHIAVDDIDWVEVVPHELIVDTSTGEIRDLIVHDLDYELAHAAPERIVRRMMIPTDEKTTLVEPVALTSTNRQKVADYALKYAKSPNTNYKLYDLDCTNFVSQAMLAGGWHEISHPVVDYKWDNAWWYGGIPTNSWTWSGAESFYRMTKALSRTTTANYVSDLRVGDLLQYKNKTSSTMTHSMVVTYKSGANTYLSYHTTNTKNRPFSEMSGYDVYWFGHFV